MTTAGDGRKARIERALERIKTWMNAHDAAVLVENLAEGATPAELDACEREIGFALPTDLRALWSIHAGQASEQNGFVGMMDLLGPETGPAEQESLTMFIGQDREQPSRWSKSGVTEEEVMSDAWLAFAGRGYADLMVVSGVSGRVFTCRKDVPALKLVASSVLEWVEAYADRVEAGEYVVEEGFGERYLSRRNAIF